MILDILTSIMIKYGLFGLFTQSFLSSLVFIPAFTELIIPVYLGLKFSPFLVLLAVSLGSILGGLVDYYMGFFGSKILFKKRKEIKVAKEWLNKWGDLSVFLASFLPIPFDFVAITVGFLRMDIKAFSIAMSIGKTLKYAAFVFGVEFLLKFLTLHEII